MFKRNYKLNHIFKNIVSNYIYKTILNICLYLLNLQFYVILIKFYIPLLKFNKIKLIIIQ